jgi:hypothetical protein
VVCPSYGDSHPASCSRTLKRPDDLVPMVCLRRKSVGYGGTTLEYRQLKSIVSLSSDVPRTVLLIDLVAYCSVIIEEPL